MKNADDATPPKNILPDDSDLGPEPEWLLDDDEPVEPEPSGDTEVPARPEQESSEPVLAVHPEDPGLSSEPAWLQADDVQAIPETLDHANVAAHPEPLPPEPEETTELRDTALSTQVDTGAEPTPAVVEKKELPWLWGLVPLAALMITGLIAWLGTNQMLNNVSTWDTIHSQTPPLLPARWAMMTWWAVIALLAVFLIYGALPRGRLVTRIKVTGPLILVGLVATNLWIFSQHWQWSAVGIISIGITVAAVLVTYLLVVLGPHIKNIRQRLFAVAPLSAALGYSVMLSVLTWQSYSAQPFGERGSSLMFALVLVILAAIFSFFLRDGLFALVLAIWFAGVVHFQWGEDALISLIAAVAVVLTGVLAGLGTILATESHRPSLTTSVENRRGRTSFFRKKDNSLTE